MGYICILKSKTHRSDESLVLWRLTSKILTHETYFVDPPLPTFLLSLTRTNNFKHLGLSHWLYLFDGYRPFPSFFFSFLFHHIGQHLRIPLLFSIHKICRYCTFLNIFNSAFGIFLFMLFDSFFHLYFLFKPLFVKQLGLNTF